MLVGNKTDIWGVRKIRPEDITFHRDKLERMQVCRIAVIALSPNDHGLNFAYFVLGVVLIPVPFMGVYY